LPKSPITNVSFSQHISKRTQQTRSCSPQFTSTDSFVKMRPSLRLLATASRILEPYTPTGIAGLTTHPAPRSALLYLYTNTLNKLKALPASSAYRQSTEALTKHRLAIVEGTKPEGFQEWLERIEKLKEQNPELEKLVGKDINGIAAKGYVFNLHFKKQEDVLDQNADEEWDGEVDFAEPEGAREVHEKAHQAEMLKPDPTVRTVWEPEPPLTAEQIGAIEQKIGAGLIEEVIQVAEGELKLVDTLAESKVWEDLTEKPLPEQWKYFDRINA
jgi:NADH dehydrogenase (ubiquinone) 1 alpha subcomplex subunit 5